MELYQILTILWAFMIIAFAPAASADIAEIDRLQAQLVNGKRPVNLETRLKKDHGLSEGQLARLRTQGLDDRQITIAARLAKASRQPIETIAKMRVEQNKNWGEIADHLGVDPREAGLKITRKVRWEYRERAENPGTKPGRS